MAGVGHVIANNVRAERARRRMTQADLAQAIGWPRSSIHDIEAGRRKISPDDLVALCHTFSIALAELAPPRPAHPRHLKPRAIGAS